MRDTSRPHRLAFYNHVDAFLIEEPARTAWKKLMGPGQSDVPENDDWMHVFDVAVLHGARIGSPETKVEYATMLDDRTSKDGFVCIFISQDDLHQPPTRVDGPWGVRYVLSVTDATASELIGAAIQPPDGVVDPATEAWYRLFQAVEREGCLDAWFEMRSSEFDEEHALLTRVFGRVDLDVAIWEAAAYILCQGFLAVFAAVDDLAASTIGGRVEGVDGSLGEEVEAPRWWKTVLGERMPAWAGLPRHLMSAIYDRQGDGAIPTAVVAQAYFELQRRLR